MATFNKFTSFVQALGEEKHNLGSDVLKAVFTNTAPVAGNTVLANLTQIATGGGYTQMSGGAGGITLDSVTWSGGKLTIADETFTASGAVATFRYVVLVNESAPNDELIGWYDRGAGNEVTMAAGETFIVDFDGTNGVFTLA